MKKKKKTFAGRLSRKMLIWMAFITIGLAFIIFHFANKATREFYTEVYHHKMLVTYEYTRRVISDVYVAVTNNIYYLEHSLDKPEGHKDTMERITANGTRIRSCGISFIKDYYYPKTGHRFCPFAWRNAANLEIIFKEDMGDADLDYLDDDWFLDVLKSDSAQWSEPFYDGYDNKTTLSAYMVPIHDQEGRTVAVLGADISLDWLTSKLSETDSTMNLNSSLMTRKLNLMSNSYIINYDGTYLTHHDEGRIMKENFFTQLESCEGSDVDELVNHIKEGILCEDKHHDKYLVNGNECFVFYMPVKYTKWAMVTVVPCQAIDAVSYLNGGVMLVLVLVAMLMIIAVCHYYMRTEIEPVKQLTILTNEIAKGNFDAPMPDIAHDDEIGKLRESIERMQFSLSNYVDEVKEGHTSPPRNN